MKKKETEKELHQEWVWKVVFRRVGPPRVRGWEKFFSGQWLTGLTYSSKGKLGLGLNKREREIIKLQLELGWNGAGRSLSCSQTKGELVCISGSQSGLGLRWYMLQKTSQVLGYYANLGETVSIGNPNQ